MTQASASALIQQMDNRLRQQTDAGDQTPRPGPKPRRRTPRLTPVTVQPGPAGHIYRPRSIGPHQDLALLRSARTHGEHVLMLGPGGTGKTELAHAAFPDGLHHITCGPDQTEADWVGTFVPGDQPNTYTWEYGPLARAVMEAVPLFADEITLGDPALLAQILHPVMDRTGVLRITSNPGLRPLPVPDGFFVIAAGNPDVPGARLAEPLRSRFHHHLKVDTDWDTALELGVPEQIVRIATNLDQQRRQGVITTSPQMRDLLAFRDNATRYGDAHAANALLARMPDQDQPIVRDALKAAYPKVVPARLAGRFDK